MYVRSCFQEELLMKRSTPNANAQRDSEKDSLIDSRWVYRGRIVNLRLDTYRLKNRDKIAEIIDHSGAVVIVPVDQKGRLILVQQWRRAVKEITIELPAGMIEKDEPPKLCAIRELQEETGFRCDRLTELGGFYSAPGFCNEFLHLFVAEELQPSPLPPDDDEGIDLLSVTLEEAIGLIEKNTIHDAKTVAGILRYALWNKKCASG